MELKELLTSPVTVFAAVASALGTIGFIEPTWSLVSATSGMWFPAVSVTAGVILPEVGYKGLGTTLLVGAAVVYVAVQLDRLVDRVVEWRKNR